MAQWFKDAFSGRGGGKRSGGGGWHVVMGNDIRLSVPSGLPNETKWETWGRIQVHVLSLIQNHWPETHNYVRFNAFPPGYFADKLGACPYEIVSSNKEEVFLLPDCQDRRILETIFSVLGMIRFTRCIFVLDNQPAHWREEMSRLFDATKRMAKKQSLAEYDSELSKCRCLAYSVNEDLVIGKVDMMQSELTKLLETVAREERISVMIKRK